MKKTLRLIAATMAIAVVAVSCQEKIDPVDPVDPTPETPTTLTFKASFASSSTSSKTEWAAGDTIIVMSVKGTETKTEILKAAAAGKTAEFTSDGTLAKDADGYYAYVPGTGVAGFSDGKYWISDSNAVKGFVVASSTDTNLEFKGLFPLLSVKVEDAETATVELTANNGETINQTCQVAFLDMSATSKTVSETPSVQTVSISEPQTVVFALRPGLGLSGGYTVKALDANGELVAKVEAPDPITFSPSTAYTASALTRNRNYGTKTVFDPTKVKLSFGIISDTHIDGPSNTPSQKLKSALQQIQAKSLETDSDGVDAILVNGDLINNAYSRGNYDETSYFKSVYESVFDPQKVPMIYSIGNHDVYQQWTSAMVSNASNISSILGSKYFEKDQDNDMRKKYECRHCIVGDYHILCISPNSSTSPSAGYDPQAVAWLDNQLKQITTAEPEKYVFVLTHPMIYNTVYGSDLLYGSLAWYTTQLTSTLQKYPQVLVFGGHLHFPLNDPRSIWQGAFTAFGTASTRYMALEAGGYENMAGATTMNDKDEYSEGYVFQIDEYGNVRVIRMDFYRSAEIGDYEELSYPQTDLSHLRPYSHLLRSGANQPPTMTKVEAGKGVTGYTAKWTKATDDEFAHHYVVTLTKDNSAYATYKVLADFYRNPKKETMKDEYSLYLGDLSNGEYKVTVIAYDSWGAASNECSATFTAGGSSASTAASVYVDVDFSDKGVTDSKGNATITNQGVTVAKTAVSHNGTSASVYAATFSGDNYVAGVLKEITSFSAMQGFASNSFSVETFYVDKAPGTAAHGSFCATEMGGWGLAVRATGVPYFIVGDSSYNTYKSVDATSAESSSDLTHVVGVYDASTKRIFIYVNGKLNNSTTIYGPFYPGKGDTYNRFILGGDTKDGSVYGDFKPTNMVMVDAKLYTGALTAAEVETAYETAVSSLK